MSIFYVPDESTQESEIENIEKIENNISKLSAKVGNPTSSNSNNEIVKRGPSGGFAAGIIQSSGLEVSGITKLAMPLKDALGTSILNIVSENTHVGKDISVAGTYNTAVGSSALKVATVDATLNTAVGHRSLEGLTTGTHNVAIGYRTGSVGTALTTGMKCILIGADARTSSASMTNSIALGFTAVVDADNCIQLGNGGITAVKTSGTLYAAGLESYGATPTILNIASQNNTSVLNLGSGTGVQSINMGNNGVGKTTITVGSGTDEVKVNLPLKDSVTGFSILSVTSEASTGNTAVGSRAMSTWTGTANTFVGSDIGFLGTGVTTANTVVGSNAMKWVSTGGNNNCAMGHKSLEALTSGNNNVAIGQRAGFDNGSRNLTTGNQNVLIGSEARTTTGTMNNSIAIGYGSLVDADNTVQLGNTSITSVKTSGTITAAAPTAGAHLTTKTYVDDKFTTLSNQNLKTTDDAVFNSVTASNSITAKSIMGIGLAGGTFVAPTSQGAGISWNRGSTNGRTCFTNQQGGGAGGWEWLNYSNTNVPSANPQMTLDIAGNLSVIGGLKLPTTGGTAATLNHYEEYTFSTTFDGAASVPAMNVSFVRIGSLVTMNVVSPIIFTATATSSLNSQPIPARFRVLNHHYKQIECSEDGIGGIDGLCIMAPGGTFSFSKPHLVFFQSRKTYTVQPFSMSYCV